MQESAEKEELKGKPKNLYNCKQCGNVIITEDTDEGTTPFQLPCVSFGGCRTGSMYSFGYNVPPTLVASHEFFKNGNSEVMHIRKIKELRKSPTEDDRLKPVPKKMQEGTSARTILHEKFNPIKKK